MPNSKKEIEDRVLEAEKVVVSNILHNWRKKYGMDYIIVVRNGPGDVFVRSRYKLENREELLNALEANIKR